MPTKLTPAEFAGKRVLVVGEAILDEYIQGSVMRLSREAPVPVVENPDSVYRCGGAANAAANVSSLGGKVSLLSTIGSEDDPRSKQLLQCCKQIGIQCDFIAQKPEDRTNIKQRVIGDGQQLLRIDSVINASGYAKQISDRACKMVADHDAVLLSDYGTGLLEQAGEIITQAAKDGGVPVVVDPHGDDWSRYHGADLLKPSLDSFASRKSLDDPELVDLLKSRMEEFQLGMAVLTGGRQGMLVCDRDKEPRRFFSRAVDVNDVTGAGDTVAAVLALGLAAGGSIDDAAELANKAAGIVVCRLGAVPVRPLELTAMPAVGGRGKGMVSDLDGVLTELKMRRAEGAKTVMTNGCFDILHVGHLNTLNAASALGDILVVAVNDDDSVRSLKGRERPFIMLRERMQLLAALGCIDYVLPFSGRDAAAVAAAIAPDFYVKGGDWEGQDPPEASVVREQGGRVIYEPFREERSTTSIADAIRRGRN